MGTIEEVPEQYAQLKYVLFSWPNTPLLKKDHLAKHFFKHNVTMDTFAQAVGGFPLTVYEAVLPSSSSAAKGTHLGVPELFLPASTCNALISLLAHEMGPSRAQASWKPSAWHSRVELERGCPSGRIRTHCFASQEALENRFAELKDQDDWAASKPHWRELRRAQECWARGVEGARRGALTPVAVAIDIETWEEDHDTITEVGIASVAVRPDGSFEEKTEHYVVAENAHLRNGRYCPDHRDSFQYGTSVVLPSAEISSLLHELLSASSPSSSSSSAPPPPPPPAAPSYSSALSSRTAPPVPPSAPPPPPPLQGPLFLLLHDARSDVKSLSQLDLQMNLFERVLPPPTSPPFSLGLGGSDTKGGAEGATMAFLLDTQKIISGWTRRKKQMKLGDAAAALGVELTHAHNAGNDAYATLHVFLRLMTAFIGTSADEIPESMLRGNAA